VVSLELGYLTFCIIAHQRDEIDQSSAAEVLQCSAAG